MAAHPTQDVADLLLTEAEVEQLAGRGWFVRDGFLGRAEALALRAAAESLYDEGGLRPAAVSRWGNRRVDREIRGDELAWLRDHLEEPRFAALRARFEDLRGALNRQLWLGLSEMTVQLARYPGDGSGYQRHFDAFRGSVNRRVTAILYLNPAWRPEHGGQLVLCGQDTAVEPHLDRLLVFLSEQIEHEVAPSFAVRWAVTAWYRTRDTERPVL